MQFMAISPSSNERVSLVEQVMLSIITNHDQKDRD